MNSIQNKITIYIVAGTTALLLAAGLILDHLLRDQLEREFERNLLAKLMTMVTMTEQEDGEIEFDLEEELMSEFASPERPEYFQLWLVGTESVEDGIVTRSSSLGDVDLPHAELTLDEWRFNDLALPDGRLGKSVQLRFVPFEEIDADEDEEKETASELNPTNDAENAGPVLVQREVDLVLAKGRENIDELILRMRTTLATAFILSMIGLAIIVRFGVTQGLKPLKRIAKEVQVLDVNKLDARIRDNQQNEELAPITKQLNQLLERLHGAFQREKRFSGNVAHELRTPIAELRTMAEVGKEWPAEREMVKGFFGDLVNLADDMERTITNLLMLARLDSGQQIVTMESINLSHLVETVWKRLSVEANEKEITLSNHVPGNIAIKSDKDKFTLILINILSNAVHYSPRDSSVLIETKHASSGITLTVANTVVDLQERDLELIFDRFWRKDAARTGGNHAGLGLSLVKALADVLNLRIKALLHSGERFTMSLSELSPA